MAIAEAYRKKKVETNKGVHIHVIKRGNFMKTAKAEMSKLNTSKPTIIIMYLYFTALSCYRIMNNPTQYSVNYCLVKIIFTSKMFTMLMFEIIDIVLMLLYTYQCFV